MPQIDINLETTPDEFPNISVGVHLFEVIKYEEDADDEGNAVHAFQLKCLATGPDEGLLAFERFNFKYKPAQIKFKHFVVSAGLAATNGVEAADLVGKTVRGIVKPNIYTDKNTGEQIEKTQIKDYAWKPDQK